MAERQASGSRASKPARRRPGKGRRLPIETFLTDLGAARPPCSIAEREIADAVQRRLAACGLRPEIGSVRAPTSPTWPPLLRALLRVWAAAFLAAGWPIPTLALAAAAVLAGIPAVGGLLRWVPVLGARSRNVVALQPGRDPDARPIIVVAHLDTHPTADRPMRRTHSFLTGVGAWVLLVTAALVRPGGSALRPVAALVAFEAVLTLGWLAKRELETPKEPPDDNTSGVMALIRAGELVADAQPLRDVWLVATGAGTSGSCGMASFLKARPQLREAWVVEIDALGPGEMLASPFSARFPNPGTPSALIRAVAEAARLSGDPLSARRVFRPHSDARAALRKRVAAIVLTGGLHPPAGPARAPDPANAERAARIVDRLARLET